MKLIDRLGLAANSMDKRLIGLLKEVDTVLFEESYTGQKDLKKTVVIADGVDLPTIFRIAEEHGLSFVVQNDHKYFLYNLVMTALICKYPDTFMKNPISVITKNAIDNENTICLPFSSSADLPKILEKAEEFVQKNRSSVSIKQNLKVIINELFTNAMYSAPTDENGNYLFSRTSRREIVKYPDEKMGEIYLSFNDEILGVVCRDPYGSVNRVRVQKRLHQVFHTSKLAQVEHRQDENVGSGLGLKMVIENSIGFGMVVNQGRETLVYATLPVGAGNKKVSRFTKNICFNFY